MDAVALPRCLPSPRLLRTAPQSRKVPEAGFGHVLPSQPCFSSCLIFLHSREGGGDVCVSLGQTRPAEDPPAQSPPARRPADSGIFASKPRVAAAWLWGWDTPAAA